MAGGRNALGYDSTWLNRLDSQPDRQAEVLAQLTMAHVVSQYQHPPVTNGWHLGEVVVVDGDLRWRNNAGVRWTFRAELGHGQLIGGADTLSWTGFPHSA